MPQLKAGFAIADITPPVGVPMAGYASRDHASESVETPLTVSALVLRQGSAAAAIAFADLISATPELTAAVRETVACETSIPADSIMICGSHTHWGPELRYSNYMPPHLAQSMSEEYLECLKRAVAGCITQASRTCVPASTGWGSGLADGISFNRRPVGPDAKVAMNLTLEPNAAAAASREGLALRRAWPRNGHRGPRLSEPVPELGGLRAGVSDPEIPILRIVADDGAPICAVVNFACHPVVGGEDNFYAISPDYPHQARQAFTGAVGAPLAFSLGCAGDQVPAWRGGDSRVRVGRSLGAAAARAWYQIDECRGDVPLATARQTVRLSVGDLPSVEEARRALDAAEDPEGTSAARLRHDLSLAEKYGDCIETEVWAIRVGDWAAVALPGEVMAEIGLQIKQRSPFEVTAPMSVANDSIGYVSTVDAHLEGGYEPEWSAPGPDAEAELVAAALAVLNEVAGAS